MRGIIIAIIIVAIVDAVLWIALEEHHAKD